MQGGYGALFAVFALRSLALPDEARRSRWRRRARYKFSELYECRACPVRAQRVTGVQFVSEPEISQGAGFKLRADARVRVQETLRICLGCRSKSKKCDKQLTFIVRVISRPFLVFKGFGLFLSLINNSTKS